MVTVIRDACSQESAELASELRGPSALEPWEERAGAALRVEPPNGIWCGVTNVSAKPVDVSIDIVGPSGSVVNSGSVVTIPAGATSGGAAASNQIEGFVYCRATGASVKKVHVTTCVVSFQTIVTGTGECINQTTAP